MTTLCRDCFTLSDAEATRCKICKSPRLLRHAELSALSIAHIDCDAFYATVEKRDNPELADKPLIIGGGKRGVVTTACYIARTYGIKSAMPMYKALQACPHASVLPVRLLRAGGRPLLGSERGPCEIIFIQGPRSRCTSGQATSTSCRIRPPR